MEISLSTTVHFSNVTPVIAKYEDSCVKALVLRREKVHARVRIDAHLQTTGIYFQYSETLIKENCETTQKSNDKRRKEPIGFSTPQKRPIREGSKLELVMISMIELNFNNKSRIHSS